MPDSKNFGVAGKTRQTSARKMRCPNKSASGNHLDQNDPHLPAVDDRNPRRKAERLAQTRSPWHPVFLDFARYWGFTPRLCRPYRAQTKEKSRVRYGRRNFLCGLPGREPSSLGDLNAQLREWNWGVANQRVHGTTHEQVMVRWRSNRSGSSQVQVNRGR